MIEEIKESFMCPCLEKLEGALKKEKGESAYLELCEYADFSDPKQVNRVRGQHPMKYRCEIKVEAKPGKFRKKWVTRHFNSNFCCMCGNPVK